MPTARFPKRTVTGNNVIRAAFFDIDGTLVSFRTHTISDDSIRCLDRLRENGVKLFIASGRHKVFMNNLKDYPFDGYVCMNGSLVYVGDEVVYRHPMDSGESEMIAGILEKNSISSVVYNETEVNMNAMHGAALQVLSELAIEPLPPASLVKVAESPVYQYTPVMDDESFKRLLAPRLYKSVATRWHPAFLDIVPCGSSKAVGLEKAIEYFGISRAETVAFGDGENDIPMLEYAGTGIAMGNASETVKSMADYVTDTVDREGVRKALEHFCLL